jgi:hypothetical protein
VRAENGDRTGKKREIATTSDVTFFLNAGGMFSFLDQQIFEIMPARFQVKDSHLM